jgi:phosphatidylserine/phosphatidylglycerophosphate/cardiolipin synthase-like enzyme
MEFLIGKQFPKKVIPLIDSAQKTIEIIVFDWRWYPQEIGSSVQLFNQAIARAAKRGVKIRAIVSNDEIARVLNSVGCEAKKLASKNLVHCKLMLIDDSTLILGSHNYTQSAFYMNFELSVALHAPGEFGEVKSFFENLYLN